jgi:hypothetical protein
MKCCDIKTGIISSLFHHRRLNPPQFWTSFSAFAIPQTNPNYPNFKPQTHDSPASVAIDLITGKQ